VLVVYLLYLLVILGLIFWIENPVMNFNKSLIIRRPGGAELQSWLKNFQWGQRQDLAGIGSLPQYKFYTDIIETMLNLARKLGGNYQQGLFFLRERLQSDLQFEKKIQEQLLGIWLQMLLMTGLTWGFIIGALHITGSRPGFWQLGFILLWQVIGLTSLPFGLRYFRRKFFGDIGKLWKMLHVLHALSRMPVARSEIMKLAGVQAVREIRTSSLASLVEKLKDICRRALQNGGSYEDEVVALMRELEFQENWHFELFTKRLAAMKLALLAFFFLPSYLGFIFLLIGDLLKML
jgi:hypothetical protein